MVTTKLNLSMTEPQVRQIYAKQGDTGRVLDITLDQTPEDGTLRILRPDGTEVTSEAVTGGEVSENGETVTFESMTEADVTELTVGIEPVQDLSHGDPSPSNICPITGHDEVTVTRTGKNLCPTFTSGTRSGLTYTVNDDGSVHVTGTCTGTAFWAVQLTLPKGTYVLSGAPTNGQLTLRSAQGGGAPSSAFSGILDDYGNGATFTVSETASAWLNIRSTAGTHDKMYYPMIRLASETDTTYEPYRSNTYTTSLGQTVYGGTLDMVTGQLVVDRAMVDMGSLNWERYNEIQTAYVYLASLVSQGMDTSSAKLLSSGFKCRDSWTGLINLPNGEMQSHPSLAYAYARCDSYTTASDFKNAVTGQQLVYELATPQTYTLTAQQIKTLVGTNNVWASSGDIVNITFTYGGLLSELPSEATSVVGKCYCDVEQNGVSSMPFTLNVKKNERES